jgi:hypothetical protein
MRLIAFAALLAALPGGALAQTPAAVEQPLLHTVVGQVEGERMRADLTALVGFGTRHTMSDTLSKSRGIGAARRWVFAQFQAISAQCGNCLEVRYMSDVQKGSPTGRIKEDVNIVNVVAILRGRTEPSRHVMLSGDIDSRVSDVMNATSESPGANDNASGIAALLEAARLLSKHQPAA